MSTGMSDLDEIQRAYDVLRTYKSEVSILHCVSQYPTPYENLNLVRILQLQDKFTMAKIGFSDHTTGILASSIAVALGAELIEKHVTLDREFKGSDHAGSLTPEGFVRFVRDIRNTESSLGGYYTGEITDIPAGVESARKKLRRSLGVKNEVWKGEEIEQDNLIMISPGGGLEWADRHIFTGREATEYIPQMTLLTEDMI
jgi:sialic acid synthase